MNYIAKYQVEEGKPPTFAIFDDQGKRVINFENKAAIRNLIKLGGISDTLFPGLMPYDVLEKSRKKYGEIFARDIASASLAEVLEE